ncbi:MAG: hypothetical protein ACXV76_07065 [Halobacteriota archaeon]
MSLEASNERNDEQDDEHDDDDLPNRDLQPCDASKSKQAGNDCNDQEDDRPPQKRTKCNIYGPSSYGLWRYNTYPN